MPLVLMTAPLAPHIAEELWERLGHERLARLRRLPDRRPAVAHVDTVEIAVQVNGKVRARLTVAGRRSTRRRPKPRPAPTSRSPRCSRARRCARSIVVPGRLVNFVVG